MPISSNGRTAIRGAVGLAPLGLALLMSRAVLPNPGGPPALGSPDAAVCSDDIEGVRGCHDEYPTGCSRSGKYDGFLNLLKNQLPQPTAAPVKMLTEADFANLDKNTPKELSRDNHKDFQDALAKLGEGQIHSVVAYLYYAKPSGMESTNCGLSEPDAIDYHIGIGFRDDLAKKIRDGAKLTPADHNLMDTSGYIVEMTPHYRLKYHPDWSVGMLRAALGRQVKVTGQLMIDNEHNNSKDNCALGNGEHCWRASTWELHPVIQFQVCKADTCAATSADWVDLEDFEPAPKAKSVTAP